MKWLLELSRSLVLGRAMMLASLEPDRPQVYRTLPGRLWLRHSAFLISQQGRSSWPR